MRYRFTYTRGYSQAILSLHAEGETPEAALAAALPGFRADDIATRAMSKVDRVISVRRMRDGRLAALCALAVAETLDHRPMGECELWFGQD